MSASEFRQRLVAILAADAAGYSGLMAANERRTVAALDAARAIFRSQVESNQGRVIDMAGDSVLAIFEVATGAVSAALSIQQGLGAMSGGAPDGERLLFRIGVHLGEIIEKTDGTVYGDGVNVAARLQTLAEPGGVVVSDAVRSAVGIRVCAAFIDQGEQVLKNIPTAVRWHRAVSTQADGRAAISHARTAVARTADEHSSLATDGSPKASGEKKPSIAVLAFDNMSSDPAQGYFCDGISEDIITDLSKINGLAVIGRQSSFTYKGKASDVRRIGQELGVRYVLEGSVRKAGSGVRVSAQLVESETGTHLWANRYDREWNDAFLMGDEIAQDIVTSLDIEVGRGEDVRIWRKATRSPKARDAFYEGQDAYYRSTQKDNRRARELFLEAIRLEPDSAQAYASAAATHALDVIHGWSTNAKRSLEEANDFAKKALELDDDNAAGHYARGFVLLFEGRYEDALAEGARAVELRPMCSGPNASLAYIQLYSGQLDNALSNARTAVTLNPIFPGWYLYLMGAAEYFCGRHEQSLATLSQALAVSPGRLVARVLRIAALDAVHHRGDAKAEAVSLLGDHPDFSISRFSATQPLSDKSRRDQYLAALRRSGLPD